MSTERKGAEKETLSYFAQKRVECSTQGRIELEVSADDEDVAYVRLPAHPGPVPGTVKKTMRLREMLPDYGDPDLNLDFDANNVLIGIEILA
jgi:hypothetical protein